MTLFVSNLPNEASEEDLRTIFESFGLVTSIIIIENGYYNENGRIGFVEMPNKPEARSAINSKSTKKLMGQVLTVHEDRRRGYHKDRRGVGRLGKRRGRRDTDFVESKKYIISTNF